LPSLPTTNARPNRLHTRVNTLAGSGTDAGANGPEILGCRRSLKPPGAEMFVLTMDSPFVATMVKKLLPLPKKYVNIAGGSGVPVGESASTVITAFPLTQFGHTPGPPTNGLMIRSP